MNLSQAIYQKIPTPSRKTVPLELAGWLLLGGSWALLAGWLHLVLPGWPFPWLTRTEDHWLPALSLPLASLALILVRLRRPGRVWAPWLLAAMNLLLFLLCLELRSLTGGLARLSWFQAPYAGSLELLFSLLALNLFLFQFRLNMEASVPTLSCRRGLGLLLGLDILAISLVVWFPALWAGLSWFDQLFYPYTPVIIMGFSLVTVAILLLLWGSLNQTHEAGATQPVEWLTGV
jgi:hypothetical protein